MGCTHPKVRNGKETLNHSAGSPDHSNRQRKEERQAPRSLMLAAGGFATRGRKELLNLAAMRASSEQAAVLNKPRTA